MNPKQIEKIVLPLDGSDLAASAIPWAGLISSHTKAAIDLVGATRADDAAENLSTLANRLEASKKELETQSSHVSAFAEEGNPPAVIADHARNTDADLIIMASHGRSGAIGRLMGSVSNWVLRLAVTPVMIVKPESGAPNVQQVVYPLAGEMPPEGGLELAAGISRDLSVPLSLVHITQSAYRAPKNVEQAIQELTDLGIDAELHVEQGDPKERVTWVANNTPGTLVVLESATSSGIDLGKAGSFAEHLFTTTSMPTIIVPSNQ
jgi:nucleotide-binding universal stress UspA family protein